MDERQQGVPERGVALLDPRYEFPARDEAIVHRATGGNLAAAIPDKRNGQHASLLRRHEGRNDIRRIATRREAECNVAAPAERAELASEHRQIGRASCRERVLASV